MLHADIQTVRQAAMKNGIPSELNMQKLLTTFSYRLISLKFSLPRKHYYFYLNGTHFLRNLRQDRFTFCWPVSTCTAFELQWTYNSKFHFETARDLTTTFRLIRFYIIVQM